MAASVAKLARPAFPGFDHLTVVSISDHSFDGAAGAGDTVVIDIAGLALPADYSVGVTPSIPAIVSVSSKTTSGFQITLSPVSANDRIPAGVLDVQVVA